MWIHFTAVTAVGSSTEFRPNVAVLYRVPTDQGKHAFPDMVGHGMFFN